MVVGRLPAALSVPLDDLSLRRIAPPCSAQRTAPSKRSLIPNPNPLLFTPFLLPSTSRRKALLRCEASRNYDHIPKQFREENLKDGLMDNFKNVPWNLYGLTPSQMEMFMNEDNPVNHQAAKVTEESISSAKSYRDDGGIWSLPGKSQGSSKYRLSASMYYGRSRGYGRPRRSPPDLPSLLLDARIVFLGMPIFPAVSELIVAELLWLDYDDRTKPIYVYINSPGTQNYRKQIIANDTEAYAIADVMLSMKSKVYTINTAMAFGQAGMLFSLGAKGYRALQPSATTQLYIPRSHRSSGDVSDIWIRAKELNAITDYYIELLSRGIGKPKEQIREDLPRFFSAEAAIEYGIADRIIQPEEPAYEKRLDNATLLAQSKANAQRRLARARQREAESSSSSM
ncbi:hypothetical protein HPP92_023892 [Vanilla planifolia]|uniref:ATP-dependent Clp protease proteolytic subunit n=1 Tax=Vanilla planifolia TaxID=51239 RepID=A0A835PLN7_VANPL|nr:hypothetical protein HPP92_024270 [Vanilla planifolia]KAG0456104.1 hypothetical protein HPP92_023892 [Vanilla planifolia]